METQVFYDAAPRIVEKTYGLLRKTTTKPENELSYFCARSFPLYQKNVCTSTKLSSEFDEFYVSAINLQQFKFKDIYPLF